MSADAAPHLGEEPVHKDGLVLSEPVDPEDTLNIVGGVPRGVEDDDPVGGHQVDPQRAGPCRNEEQTTSGKSASRADTVRRDTCHGSSHLKRSAT